MNCARNEENEDIKEAKIKEEENSSDDFEDEESEEEGEGENSIENDDNSIQEINEEKEEDEDNEINSDTSNNDTEDPFPEINHNNILLANFATNKELIEYSNRHKNCIKYISYTNNAEPLDKNAINERTLNINVQNDYNNLITSFWGVSENELLDILKKCRIQNPPKIFAYKCSKYSTINNQTLSLFNLTVNTTNLNRLNALRNKTFTEVENSVFQKECNEMEKYFYFSNIVFKKYLLLFYDIKKRRVISAKRIFKNHYYYLSIIKLPNNSHKEILTKAHSVLMNNTDRFWFNIYQYCEKINKALNNMFTSKEFEYHNEIVKIKNIFKSNNYFKKVDSPETLFLQDLMKLKMNFDYYQACEFYNKKLSSKTKIRYELRYVQGKLIHDYMNILLINLKKKEKKLNKLKNKKNNKNQKIIDNLSKKCERLKRLFPEDSIENKKNKNKNIPQDIKKEE